MYNLNGDDDFVSLKAKDINSNEYSCYSSKEFEKLIFLT